MATKIKFKTKLIIEMQTYLYFKTSKLVYLHGQLQPDGCVRQTLLRFIMVNPITEFQGII